MKKITVGEVIEYQNNLIQLQYALEIKGIILYERDGRYEDALTSNGLLLHLLQFLDRILFLTKDRDDSLYKSRKKKRDIC